MLYTKKRMILYPSPPKKYSVVKNNVSVPVPIGDLHWSLASLSESAIEKGNGCLSRTSLNFFF